MQQTQNIKETNSKSAIVKTNNTPFFTPAPVIQKKMEIGAVHDVFEAEADAMADKVMQSGAEYHTSYKHTGALIQTKCAHCQEEEERIRRKPLVHSISNYIQKSALTDVASAVAPTHIESSIYSSKGGGQNMDTQTRSFMESRFGVDFSSVRIHTNSTAVQMSQELNAKAFTVGNDIYFNQGQYNPDSSVGKHLLAHELTHTIQQGGSQVKRLPLQKTTQPKIQRGFWSRVGNGIADAASTAWDYTGGAVIRFGGRVIEWVEDRAVDIINEIAPGLIDFLRSSIWEPIRDMIAEGLDRLTGGLFSRLQEEGLSGIIREFVDAILETVQGTIADACRSFAQLAEKVFNFIRTLSGGALARLRSVFNRVSGFFSGIWNDYAQPAMSAIRHFASDAWNWIVEKAQWLWDLIEPIRNAIAAAWNWLRRMFNIAWEGASSVWDWLVEKATQAWEWIKSAIEPIKTPLMIIGGILIMLSPLGPFVALGAAVYGIYRAVQWVRTNWNSEVMVRFRTYLQQNILTPIQNGIEQLRSLVNSALSWISGMFQRLQAAFTSLVNAVTSSSIFVFLRGIVQTVANAIQDAATWVVTQCRRIGQFIANIAQRVWTLIRPIVSLVAKLIILSTNPWLIPIVLMAWYWRILPDCFKPPIINFVLRVMIGVLRAMPNFAMFGETWPRVKTTIITFLQEKLEAPDEVKTAAVNRVAVMVSEMDLTLLSNQIAAASGAPAEFGGQMQEELIGVNLNTPLPFERTTMEEPSLVSRLESSGISEHVSPEDAALFSQTQYSNEHIGVDAVGTFAPSPELEQNILSRTGAEGAVEFGNSTDSSRTVHGILGEMLPTGMEGEGNATAESGGSTTESEATTSPTDGESRRLSPEEETELRLQQMIDQSTQQMATQPCTTANASEGGGSADAASAFPEAARFGPLTPAQRARYTLNQMYNGMGHWWNCNRHWLIPTIIGTIIVVVLAIVLSGGAVLEAIPAILSVLTPIMIGVAVVRASYYLGEYVYKSISGDIPGASRSLARAFAVAAVEAIFALLGSSAFWKTLRNGVGAVGRTAARVIGGAGRLIGSTGRVGAAFVRTLSAGGRYVMRTVGAVITRGRLMLRGIRGRMGQGLRSLEEFGERLLTRIRFRRFRLRIRNRWFVLEGYLNPWVIIMEGPLQGQLSEVDDLAVAGRSVGDDIVSAGGTRMRVASLGAASPRDYRRIFEIFHGLPEGGASNYVIHHLVEQQTRNFISHVDDLFLHSAANLRAIPRGVVNSVVHLSQIRVIWNRFYTVMHTMIAAGTMTERQLFQALRHFELYTDEYIRAMLRIAEQNSHLADDALRALMETESNLWRQNHNMQQAINDAIAFGQRF
ncbi:eCIS core domain-containing protein [Flavobacterium sp.]|uniref:eCIS core domain-containing protein n=1 Tax=Flavobacterium sp. TaxID=239 RepID=UPI003D0F5D76